MTWLACSWASSVLPLTAISKWKQERGYDKPLMVNGSETGIAKFTRTIFFEKSASMFAFRFGQADDGRDIAAEIRTRMIPSLAIALPVFLLGLVVYMVSAIVMVFFRATYVDFWGVVLCVALMSISSLFYIIGGQFLISKLWHIRAHFGVWGRA